MTSPFRKFCQLAVSLLGFLCAQIRAATFDLSTATIADINRAFDAGALTSEKLVQLYLARIEAYNDKPPGLNAIITLNPKALETARALDVERKAKGPRSPLHGIPVLAKDVYNTYDMPTTGGFKPMATSQPARDSFIIDRLRKAGAIILAKTNQADWYGVANRGASTIKGQVYSPYNPKMFPGASSSGTGAGMAAWFGAVGLGSDTGGSIVTPSSLNNLVGVSATHGLVSRTGMMWSSPSQENGGPMCRSVYDCAAVLDVIAGYDSADLPTQASVGRIPDRSYTSFIDPQGLKGARLGVLREEFRSGPLHEEALVIMDKALADVKKAGAILVDPAMTGIDLPKAIADVGAPAIEVALAINKYLAELPSTAPIRTVDEMIAKAGDVKVKPNIVTANQAKAVDHNARFAAGLKQQEMIRNALVDLMDRYQLDGLILPYRTAKDDVVGLPADSHPADVLNNVAACTGLPTIVVPGGFWASDSMPFAVQFIGRNFSEPTLIKLASGYEAVAHHRKAPALTPALAGEKFEY